MALLPVLDGWRYTGRETMPDAQQSGSQTIPYALVNYVVREPSWLGTGILGNTGGWNWFYIGALPLGALALVPLALRERARRTQLVALLALLVFLLAWHANRHTPMRFVYDWIPFLYTFRFPGRLLIVATIPLLVAAGLGLQHLLELARARCRSFSISFSVGDDSARPRISIRWIADAALVALLLFSVRDVFRVNKGMAFAPGKIDPKSFVALNWLKRHDPDLYYTNLGGGILLWGWTPAAYLLEMPIVNFKYNREVKTWRAQQQPPSPFQAKARYMLAAPDQPRPPEAVMLQDFSGIAAWSIPNALPFGFVAPAAVLLQPAVTTADVTAAKVRLDGPNRIVATAEAADADSRLVVLVSNYPGWRLSIDGDEAPIEAVNDYLGARMPAGRHEYTFAFRPTKHYVGLTISLLTTMLTLGMCVVDAEWWKRRAILDRFRRAEEPAAFSGTDEAAD